MVWNALIGAGASLLGGLFGKKGQDDANRRNIALAREQMDFQKHMSSTAYQRAAADAEKAGLNRILALGGPASTPSGAMPVVKSTMEQMSHSARNVGMQVAQIRNLSETNKNIHAQTALQEEKLKQEKINTARMRIMDPIYDLAGSITGAGGDLINEIASDPVSAVQASGAPTFTKKAVSSAKAAVKAVRNPETGFNQYRTGSKGFLQSFKDAQRDAAKYKSAKPTEKQLRAAKRKLIKKMQTRDFRSYQ